jgi:hypothetical protein
MRIACTPALIVVRSKWPILDLWETGLGTRTTGGPLPRNGQDVAIVRPGFDPIPLALPPGGAAFLQSIRDGHTLLHALAAAMEESDGFDPDPVIAGMLAHHVFLHSF